MGCEVCVHTEVLVKKISAALFLLVACQNPQGAPIPDPMVSPVKIENVKTVDKTADPTTFNTADQVDLSKLNIEASQPSSLAAPEAEIPAPTTPPDPAKLPTKPSEELIAVAARHILIQYKGSERAEPTVTRTKEEAKARIDKILLLARAQGSDFGALAKYSDEPNAEARGGSLGVFTREQMVPAFSDTAFSIGENQVSDVIETPFGYHIIQREPAYVLAQIPILFKSEDLPPQLNITRTKEEAQVRAKEASDKIKAGLSFAEASKTYSDVPFASTGNVMSEMMSNSSLGPDFKGAKDLAPGVVSDIIEIPVGYLLIQKQPIAWAYGAHILVTYKDSELTKVDTSIAVTRSKDDAKKRAEEALKKAKLPKADFGALAKEYSDDKGTKDKGGDLGQPLIRGMAPSMMTEAVINLPEGGISGVVETPYGFHIFKRLPKPAPSTAPVIPQMPPM
jgi:NIMA-interacting peptidyl-prolyl cis-trans isomerase 1